ncbi:hypothetical protein DNH61_04670 [Paenibacillus sambharensis]|uniref:Uncharacterized protein n=1 Tax=Paenibacillus sambharensis TaxID=1803190 RepID=A0A2W1LG33_9BACL|nr:hypothetical protein [Paenibacillus sambharensis]PZD97020.1 hypothetical protein DNH61_04670 [Paenibacillus sambharensis]
MKSFRNLLILAAGSYAAGLALYAMFNAYVGLAVPSLVMLGIAPILKRAGRRQAADTQGEAVTAQRQAPPAAVQAAPSAHPSAPPAAQPAAQAPGQQSSEPAIDDPELAAAVEYIGILEDMILLEGEKNSLDDEIVQKTLSLLARVNRLVPDLVALGDASINYNIVRLIRRDINSAINPFLRLSGEAKRQNRRLLLDGIKDINSKLTFYTQTIEQKDIMELRTKAELIQQRYRLDD